MPSLCSGVDTKNNGLKAIAVKNNAGFARDGTWFSRISERFFFASKNSFIMEEKRNYRDLDNQQTQERSSLASQMLTENPGFNEKKDFCVR